MKTKYIVAILLVCCFLTGYSVTEIVVTGLENGTEGETMALPAIVDTD